MKKGILMLAVLTLITLLAPKAFADDVWTSAQSDQYGKKAGGMLGRGLVNVATCFVDIIQQTVEGTQQGPPFIGTMTGLGGGLGCTALRVSSGALDVVTFWVPGFNGIPVAKSYSNCLEEEETTYYASTPTQMPQSTTESNAVVQEAPAPVKHDPLEYVKK